MPNPTCGIDIGCCPSLLPRVLTAEVSGHCLNPFRNTVRLFWEGVEPGKWGGMTVIDGTDLYITFHCDPVHNVWWCAIYCTAGYADFLTVNCGPPFYAFRSFGNYALYNCNCDSMAYIDITITS